MNSQSSPAPKPPPTYSTLDCPPLLLYRLSSLSCTLMPLQVPRPPKGSPTLTTLHSMRHILLHPSSCTCTPLICFPTPVHCQTPSAPEPPLTHHTLHSTFLLTHWSPPVWQTLVTCLVTLPSEPPPTHSALHIPTPERPLMFSLTRQEWLSACSESTHTQRHTVKEHRLMMCLIFFVLQN